MNGQQFYLPDGKTIFPIIGIRASYDDPHFAQDKMNTTFIESGKIPKGCGLCAKDFVKFSNHVRDNFEQVTINRSYGSATTLIELITNTYLSEDGSKYDYSQTIRVVVFGNYVFNNTLQSDSLYDKSYEFPHSIKPSQKFLGSTIITWKDPVSESFGIDSDQREANIWEVYNKDNPSSSFRLLNVQFKADKTGIKIGPNAVYSDFSKIEEHVPLIEDLTITYAISDPAIVLNKVAKKVDILENELSSLIGTTLGKYVAR